MLIYRYENESGYGPFTFEDYTDVTEEEQEMLWSLNKHLDFNVHPTPNPFIYKGGVPRYHFGCESIEKLYCWFNDEVRFYLEYCGFTLKIYDCPDEYCVVEQYQIGFLKDKASVLELLNV